MGTFGDEFLNVREFMARELDFSTTMPLPDERDGLWDTFIQNFIPALVAPPLNNGGYVYFPPGTYYIKRGFTIGPKLTLVIATGAKLVLPRGGDINPALSPPFLSPDSRYNTLCVEVQGALQAGPHQFLEPTFDEAGNHTGRGTMLLSGESVQQVYPEWWGARSDAYPFGAAVVNSTLGLQSAIDAAVHNRTHQFGASIPIMLS